MKDYEKFASATCTYHVSNNVIPWFDEAMLEALRISVSFLTCFAGQDFPYWKMHDIQIWWGRRPKTFSPKSFKIIMKILLNHDGNASWIDPLRCPHSPRPTTPWFIFCLIGFLEIIHLIPNWTLVDFSNSRIIDFLHNLRVQ